MDKYLSYLSSPPLLCYYSSQWSPVKHKGIRHKEKQTEGGGVDGKRKTLDNREVDNHLLICNRDRIGKLWTPIKTQRQPDGQMERYMTPSQEHKPARTAEKRSAEPHITNNVWEQL